MKRRTFLSLSAVGAAGAVVGPWFRRTSHAAAFGEVPEVAQSAMLPEDVRAESVLEVFLYGGLSAWETLYLVEEYGRPNDPNFPNQQFHTFLGGGGNSVEAALNACNFPNGEPMGQPFAVDSLGANVQLGPFAYRLRQRPDVISRMRLLVQFHTLEPHEAAVPQSLTGRPVGQPAAAGLGAHIQRYFAERGDPGRGSPFSYVFATGGISGDNVSAAAATGMHPGLARPLLIKIDNADTFASLLSRSEVGSLDDRARYDQLMDTYVAQHQERLRWQGEGPRRGELARSLRTTELVQAAGVVANVDAISGVMEPSLFDALPGQACGDSRARDIPRMSLGAARHLITHPTEPARYVCVSDIGLFEASGGGGYDTHSDNSHDTARNFDNMLQSLLDGINQPGENDPSKLDLDKTMIVLNTEFGRTPRPQGSSGRNHHPYGYVTALIGGPIQSAQRGIHGAIGPSGNAVEFVTPGENRIAALLALGIWPFSPEAFATSDVQAAFGEVDAALSVTERALGYTL